MANLLDPLVIDKDITASFVNTTIDNMKSVAYLAADLTIDTDTVYKEAALDLSLPLVASGNYVFNSCIFYATSSTADIVVIIEFPFGSILVGSWLSSTAITTAANALDISAPPTSNSVSLTCGGLGAGTVLCIRPVGFLAVSTASGNATIKFRQNTLDATVNTTLKQGSWISTTRVG